MGEVEEIRKQLPSRPLPVLTEKESLDNSECTMTIVSQPAPQLSQDHVIITPHNYSAFTLSVAVFCGAFSICTLPLTLPCGITAVVLSKRV